jgi:hypothetical protein
LPPITELRLDTAGVGAGLPPSEDIPVGSCVVGTPRTPANETQPEPSARWNQMSLFHGGEFVGYGTEECTQPSTAML